MGWGWVRTISLTETKGGLAGALVVREHEDLMFISSGGMVQRTSVRGINRYGRASQGVRVMNLKPEYTVSAVALVAETQETACSEPASEPDGIGVVCTVQARPFQCSASGSGSGSQAEGS